MSYWPGEVKGLTASKWSAVARFEYLVMTSGIRGIRPYIVYAVLPLLAVWVFFVSPILVGPLAGILATFPLTILTILIQAIFFSASISVAMIPVTQTLKEIKTGQIEILLAAPVKPGDVLFGEFLGQSPLYAIVLTLIAGFVSAVLSTSAFNGFVSLSVVVVFLLTTLTALWLGTLASALLRTRLGTHSKGRDTGRALGIFIALPLIAILYFFTSGMAFEVLADPSYGPAVRSTLSYLPSSWAADIALTLAIGEIDSLFIATRIIALIVFIGGVFVAGVKTADRFNSLEPFNFSSTMVRRDGLFYSLVRALGGGTSGALLATTFKDYIRKAENVSKLVYICALQAMMMFFTNREDGSGHVSELIPIISAIMASFVVGEITMQGKNNLFIYRKAPGGIVKLIKARFIHGGLIVAGFTGLMTISLGMLFTRTALDKLILLTVLNAILAIGGVLLSLGLFLANPAFNDKSPSYALNILLAPNIVFAAMILTPGQMPYAELVAVWVIALVVFAIGFKRIGEVE
jgi:hypothetical protein